MPDVPDINQMTPAGGKQGAPASGTYGEGADLERLKQELPKLAPAQPSVQPTPDMGAARPMPAPPAGGLPSSIFAPSQRPDEPVSTPLSMPMQVGAAAPEQRIQWLYSITQDPQADPEFKAWAQTVLDGRIR